MMTREDVLRELELLPVWQLRAPVVSPVASPVKVPQKVSQAKTQAKKDEIAETPQTLTATETSHFALVSDDKNWAFVLPQALTGAADALFNNILLALQINKTHTEAISNLANVKVIVALGEVVAQQLLHSSDTLEKLRGKTHIFESTALIATYHPNDLLQHLALKAKMWDDLCIAKPIAAT